MDFLLELLTSNFLYGAVSSLLATFIAWGCRQVYIKLYHSSKYSGTWEFQIYDERMNVIHKDLVTFQHDSKTGLIKGKAERVFPERNAWESRKVTGALMLNRLLTISYTNEPVQSTSAAHLMLKGDYYFKGYILRYNMVTNIIEKFIVDYKKST